MMLTSTMIPPQVIVPDWALPLYEPYRYKILYGGRSSGKTWQIARALVLQGREDPLRIICVREHKTALRKSAKPALEDAIRAMGISAKVHELEAKVARLEKELHTAHTILDVQGKVAGLLGFSLEHGKDC